MSAFLGRSRQPRAGKSLARTLGLEEIEIWAIAVWRAHARSASRAQQSLIADAAVRAEKNGRGELLATIKSTVGLAGLGAVDEEARALFKYLKWRLPRSDQVERIAEVNLGRRGAGRA